MTSYPNQNYFPLSPPVIRLKLTFHSNEAISLPSDTWHLMEFSKAPLVADVIDQIKFRFQLQKKFEVNLGMKGACFLRSENSIIFRDEDVIKVTVSSKQQQQHKSETTPNALKRKTGVVGTAPVLTNQNQSAKPNKKAALQHSSSDSSSQSDSKEIKSKSVLFIPRQVPATKPPAIHSTQAKPKEQPTNQNSSSSSSTSSDENISSILQTVQRGAKHIRFSKQQKPPITLRPRGRGRAFGRIPAALTNRIGPPPPVGPRDKFTAKSEVFVNPIDPPPPPQQQQQQQPQHVDSEKELEKSEDYSQLQIVTAELPPKIGATIVFKTMEMSRDYTPSQSEYRVGRVVSYDPNEEKLCVEYNSDTLYNIKQDLSERNEGKFAMEEIDRTVQSSDNFLLNELIDPRILKQN